MRAIAAELAKLFRRSIMLTFVATILAFGGIISFYLSNATVQYKIAVDNFNQIAHPASEEALCRFLVEPVGPKCERARSQEMGFAVEFLRDTSDEYPIATAGTNPIGMGGLAAGLMASLIGIVVFAGIATSHVAGEWSLGTVKTVLARDPDRVRFIVLKFISAWVVGIALLLTAWLVLGALSLLFHAIYVVPPRPGFDTGGFALEQALRCVLVLGVVAAVATAAGVLIRSPVAAFGIVLGLVFVSLFLDAWRTTFRFSLGYWIGAWMRFAPKNAFGDHVWVDRFPLMQSGATTPPSLTVAVIGLLSTIVVALLIAGARMARSDV